MIDQALKELFNTYEKAFSALDFEKIAELYADSFMSAGPTGLHPRNVLFGRITQENTVVCDRLFEVLIKDYIQPAVSSVNRFSRATKDGQDEKGSDGRIVTIGDIRNVLAYIKRAHDEGRINEHRYRYYNAFVIFGALTGQRSESTIAQVTVGQLRDALKMGTPVLRV